MLPRLPAYLICWFAQRTDMRTLEGLEARLDEGREPAAEHRLLAEEVRLGLLAKSGLDDARPATADGTRIGEPHLE